MNFIKRSKLYAMFCLDLQVHVKGYVHITIDNSLSVRKGGGDAEFVTRGCKVWSFTCGDRE